MKRLALFLDGTWNDPESSTNVRRMYDVVAKSGNDGIEQRAEYLRGVGTSWYNKLRGGIVGQGLSDNALAGYLWLVENYDDGDEIYLFGFSRGAYTARSVAGVIIKCGLVRRGVALTPAAVYERYREGKSQRPLYQLEYLASLPEDKRKAEDRFDAQDTTLLAESRRVPIHCVAVWDTVGALGIPWTAAPFVGRSKFFFHNPNLSMLIRHAYHAMAVDEHRAPYRPTLWTRFTPTQPDPPQGTPSIEGEQTVEQRWFCGAHANVGGGYGDKDLLAARPLAWLQQNAAAAGLAFTSRFQPHPDEIRCQPRDSFAEFIGGIYRVLRFNVRHYRPIGASPRQVKGGWSTPINEVIDSSVFERYRADPSYRPANLEAWAAKRGLQLAKQTTNITA